MFNEKWWTLRCRWFLVHSGDAKWKAREKYKLTKRIKNIYTYICRTNEVWWCEPSDYIESVARERERGRERVRRRKSEIGGGRDGLRKVITHDVLVRQKMTNFFWQLPPLFRRSWRHSISNSVKCADGRRAHTYAWCSITQHSWATPALSVQRSRNRNR